MRARPAISAVSAGTEVDRDAVAGERTGEQRDPSPVADGGDALGLGEEGKRAVDFVAGEKARDIRAQLLGRRRPSTTAARALNRRCRSRPARFAAAVALGGIEAEVEAVRVLRLGGRAADHRMLAQERIHLAGHVGGEARDAPVPHLDPFGMRAGGADQPVLDAGAENQRLLAAHHVRGARGGLAERPGNDVALAAALEIDRQSRAVAISAGPAGQLA